MDSISTLKTLLSNLDPPIVVLEPQEVDTPMLIGSAESSGRKIAGTQGLSKWFEAHPNGYVQLYDPTPVFSDGVLDQNIYLLDCVAPTRAKALELYLKARKALGDPLRDGSEWVYLDKIVLPLEGTGGARVQLRMYKTDVFDYR